MDKNDIRKIEILANEKFKTWQWNFGYSPKYSFKNVVEFEGKTISVELNVKRGIIEDCKILGDYFSLTVANKLNSKLQNKRHLFEEIQDTLKEITNNISDEFVYSFF